MSHQSVSLSPEPLTKSGDGDLPRTVPLRELKSELTKVVTQEAIELPELAEMPTHNLRPKHRPRQPVSQSASRKLDVIAAAPLTELSWTRSQPNKRQTPVGLRVRLRVLRGQRVNAEYPLHEGLNTIGRRDDGPLDVDLTEQEPADRIWLSRRHALISIINDALEIEDLHSRNGTYVNRTRLTAGSKRQLHEGDVIQIGTVQLRVLSS